MINYIRICSFARLSIRWIALGILALVSTGCIPFPHKKVAVSFSGEVLDNRTGRPISGVEVTAKPSSFFGEKVNHTDERGAFSFLNFGNTSFFYLITDLFEEAEDSTQDVKLELRHRLYEPENIEDTLFVPRDVNELNYGSIYMNPK